MTPELLWLVTGLGGAGFAFVAASVWLSTRGLGRKEPDRFTRDLRASPRAPAKGPPRPE